MVYRMDLRLAALKFSIREAFEHKIINDDERDEMFSKIDDIQRVLNKIDERRAKY